MKTTVNWFDFRDAFQSRDSYKNHFSYQGLRVLFDHKEQFEEETGEQIELDVIGFCCQYREATLEELKTDFGKEFATLEEAEDWLWEVSHVAGTTQNTIVFDCNF